MWQYVAILRSCNNIKQYWGVVAISSNTGELYQYLAILGSCGNAEAGREETKQGARVETERHRAVTKFAVVVSG